MSSETTNTNSSIGSYALMPSIYVGVHTLNNYRYFKNPIKPYAKGIDAKKFGQLTQGTKMDVFQRAQFSSETYEAVRSAGINAKKAAKKAKKLENAKKLPLMEQIKNIFRKSENKVKLADLKNNATAAASTAQKNLEDVKTAIKSNDVENLKNTLKGFDEGYANSLNFITAKSGQGAVKSFGIQAFDNFKKEFSFKKGNRLNAGFNIAMTALQFIPNVFEKVVPAFKNNGFKAGMTELGQTIVQAGADLVAYATGGAIGRTIGHAVGTFFGPVGTWVGGLVGDMVGSMFVGGKVCGAVEKITNKDDAINTGIPQNNASIAQLSEQQAQPQVAQTQNIQAQTPPQTQKVWTEAEVAQIEKGAQQLKAQVRAQHGVGLYA